MTSKPESSLPRRALVVDADPVVLESTAALLKLDGFDVVEAADGIQALTLFARDWYPLVITGRSMPTLDGIAFTSRLRVVALAPVYIIMLTDSRDGRDHELGYCAGVDQYLLRQNFANELRTKVRAGLTALRRRQATRTGLGSEPATVDLENGAHTARHLVGRLHAEIAHSSRSRGLLQILSIGIDADDEQVFARHHMGTTISETLLRAVHEAIRPKLDWVARLPAPAHTCRLAVVMPESTPMESAVVEQRVRNAFSHWNTESAQSEVRLSVGMASLARDESLPTALELLGQAERSRRGQDSARTGIFAIARESHAA